MSLNPDIRDQAYQFFIEEAQELLQVLESGLLELREDHSTPKVHELMRAAHSIKGGAASVELSAIELLAHRLEDFFKALYSDSVEFDEELEGLLLQGYDCLSHPLLEQIESGTYDEEAALLTAEPIFAALEVRLEDALKNADSYIPSSNDLGVDIVASIFEVDVVQALEHLEEVVANPNNYDLAAELQETLDLFAGFAELFNLPGFSEIIQTSQAALGQNSHRVLEIIQATLADCTVAKDVVLAGDRDRGGEVSTILRELAELNSSAIAEDTAELSFEIQDDGMWGSAPASDPFAEDIFGAIPNSETPAESEVLTPQDAVDDVFGTMPEAEAAIANNNLDDIFGAIPSSETPGETEVLTPQDAVDDVFGTMPEAEAEIANNNLDDIFGAIPNLETSTETEALTPQDAVDDLSGTIPDTNTTSEEVIDSSSARENLEEAVKSIENIFDTLPPIENDSESLIALPEKKVVEQQPATFSPKKAQPAKGKKAPAQLSVKVDLERLERMNNLVGELTINRNSLSLQNQQLQENVTELGQKFFRFREVTQKLREISDEIVLEKRSSHNSPGTIGSHFSHSVDESAEFDALEMDSYSNLYASIQNVLEEIVQLEESVDDITIFAKQSDRTINSQRQMLGQMRDELMWVRMLPLDKILQRFPRTLRDLSKKYHKPVELKMTGTGVLVDKAVLEKLSDPLLHLLRNGFDHGIESPSEREKQGKSPHGKIEINAYHQGNQTVIEIKDDGKGLDVEKIAQKGIEKGLISAAELANATKERIYDLIFEPGFSTAAKVSELSGRGVGMNIVRSQIETLKGRITVTSSPGEGSIFTLRLPLTLTIAKLLVCSLGTTSFALPSDSIEEIIIPLAEQIKISNGQRFLIFNGKLVPIYCLPKILNYNCPIPDAEDATNKAFKTIDAPEDWFAPLLLLRRGQKLFALEVVSLVSEQELVIKPYGKAIAAPKYSYGCTILGDGSLIPAFDGSALIGTLLGEEIIPTSSEVNYALEELEDTGSSGESSTATQQPARDKKLTPVQTIMVVDDSTALRRTMALTLEKQGYRVIQKKDGKDALDGFKQNPHLDLIICDVEMPTMNGFEFLGMRRRDSQLAKVPTFMLTSRSGAKHRNLATQLGADGYFTKPYVEQEFIVEIKKILATDGNIPNQKSSKPNSRNASISKKTILIIDDSSALRRTLALCLENKGYFVLQGRDGREGLEILRNNLQTSLAICDIEMPNMNGFEFLTACRQEPNLKSIPIIMLTSRSTEKHQSLANSLGAKGYFTKPYVEQEFIKNVDQFINKYSKS